MGSFTYSAGDGLGGFATATVNVTVGASAADIATSTTAGTPVTLDVSGSVTAASNATVAVTAVSQPGAGTVSFSGHTITYVPDADFSGTDSFSVHRQRRPGRHEHRQRQRRRRPHRQRCFRWPAYCGDAKSGRCCSSPAT